MAKSQPHKEPLDINKLTAQAVSKRYEEKAVLLKVDPPQLLSFFDRSRLSGQADAAENYRVVTFSLARTASRPWSPPGNQI